MVGIAYYMYDELERVWNVELNLNGQVVGYKKFKNKYDMRDFRRSLEGSIYEWKDASYLT